MRKSIKNCVIIGCLLLAIVAVAIVICLSIRQETEEPPAYPTIENAADLYQNAINLINSRDIIAVHITYKKEMLIKNETFTEQSTQHIIYSALGTDNMQAQVAETLVVGSHTIDITETFSKGTMYTSIDDCRFAGAMLPAEYGARYIPAAPFSSSLYKSISGVNTGDTYVVSFADPTHVELWLQTGNAELTEATGSAYINDSGYLTKSVYNASYLIDGIPTRLSATVELEYEDSAHIEIPTNPDDYIRLTDPTAPKLLEISCGYLLDAANISATITENILCEAFGDQRKQTISLETSHDNTWSAQIDTSVEIINSSKTGAITSFSQKEIFSDNTYSIIADGAPMAESKDVDINTMRSHCRDLLVGTVVLPEHVAEAVITEDNETYTIELTGNEIIAQLLDAEASLTLYQDTTILASAAQDYHVDIMKYRLIISKASGLPISSGFEYQGIYVLENLPYRLLFQSEQQYIIQN